MANLEIKETPLSRWRDLTPVQRNTFIACFLGWALDAFDFFLLTVCLKSIAAEFQVGVKDVAEAIFWTLAMRPVGALIFGSIAERWGRKPTLMLNILAFSVFGFASALAPTLHSFLICRGLFGIAMGGEWGVGAALAFETLPAKGRGFFSGILQEGYVTGNLLSAAVYGLLFSHLHGTGLLSPWRVLFMIGAFPALLALYLRAKVPESPVWSAARQQKLKIKKSFDFKGLVKFLPSFLFITLFMMGMNSFSHGTQDLYPTFIEKDKGLSSGNAGIVLVIMNLGALFGGIVCGTISERVGRRKTIIIAALLAIPAIPMWAWSHGVVAMAIGAFIMQMMVQGAWGVIPAHLNELSPAPVRAVFPGLAYQLGNLLSSRNGVFQASLALHFGGSLGPILSGTVVVVALFVALITYLGKEAKGATFIAE